MNNSLEYSLDDFDIEESGGDRRMTRVLTKQEVDLPDASSSTESELDYSFSEETGHDHKHGVAKDMINRVKGMTEEEVCEFIHKLNISEDEASAKEDEYEEGNNEVNNKQQKTRQKTQAKTISKESNKNKEELEKNSEKTTNKVKKGVKGKKNNSNSTNVNAQLEENLNKVENDDKKKIVETVSGNNKKAENITKQSKHITDVQENKLPKSKNEKSVSHGTSKEKGIKSSKTVDDDKILPDQSESNSSENAEGRVMRSTRYRLENANKLFKETDETLKELVPEKITSKNKKHGIKLESELKIAQETSEVDDELVVPQKKKTGKKEKGIKKVKDTEVTIDINEKENSVTITKKTTKKVASDILIVSQENPSSSDKNVISQIQKNHKKDNSLAVQNAGEKEANPSVKNRKTKKTTANSKVSEVEEEPQSHTVNAEKMKLKTKTDRSKNKKLPDKENKINEDTVPNKRATRKK